MKILQSPKRSRLSNELIEFPITACLYLGIQTIKLQHQDIHYINHIRTPNAATPLRSLPQKLACLLAYHSTPFHAIPTKETSPRFVCVKMPTGFPLVMLTHLSNFLSFISSSTKNRTHTRGAGALFRTKNGLGISSVSGFQTGGSPFSFSAILAAKALPFGSGLRLPSSIGRPPALACASSTSVLPLGARLPPLEALMAMLFFVAILFKSSPPLAFFLVRLDLRVGERGIFS